MNYKSVLQKCLFSAFPKNSEKEEGMHNKAAGHLRLKFALSYPSLPASHLALSCDPEGHEVEEGRWRRREEGGLATLGGGAELRVTKEQLKSQPSIPLPSPPASKEMINEGLTAKHHKGRPLEKVPRNIPQNTLQKTSALALKEAENMPCHHG